MILKKIRVADFIAKICAEKGIRHVFIVTGGGAMHLNDAFPRSNKFDLTCFHHEQAAAIAAESYYRVSNNLALLNVTSGPGGINALNGVYGAYVDSIGMLVISGQVKRETLACNVSLPLRQLGDQEVDIISIVKPIVKYATILQDPMRVLEVLDKAIYLATTGRPGPVWIDIPIDVQAMLIDETLLNNSDLSDQALLSDPDVTENTKYQIKCISNRQNLQRDVKDIMLKLSEAKRPVIMTGNGVRLSGMEEEFHHLVDLLGVPVVTGWNAHDILTNDNPYYAGRPGTVGDRAGNFAVQNSDFILILGCRLNIRQVSYNWTCFAPKAWKVMVDIDLAELEKPTLSINKPVHADLKDFIPLMIKNAQINVISSEHSKYLDWCKQRVSLYPVVDNSKKQYGVSINPYYFFELLFNDLKSDDIVVTGNGAACVMSFQAAKLTKGQRLFTNSGCASMGYDLPAAIGALKAGNGRRVICLAGDGSIMMNIQELQTVSGNKMPIKIIIINNNGYHSIRQTQRSYFPDNIFGEGPDSGVTLPDFVSIAKAFDINATRVVSPNDWRSDAVRELLDNNLPAVIDVIVDPAQPFSPKLTSKKLADGSMQTPTLENMEPFLSEEELLFNSFMD